MHYDNITQAVIDSEFDKAVPRLWEWLSEQFANLNEYEKKHPDKKELVEMRRQNLRFIDRCFKIFMHKARSMEQDAKYWHNAWKKKQAEVTIRRHHPQGIHPVERMAILKTIESDEVKSSNLYDPAFVYHIKQLLTEQNVPMRNTQKAIALSELQTRLRHTQKQAS